MPPELVFRVEGAGPRPAAATPELAFRLAVLDRAAVPIHSVALRCQVRIEPARRAYTAPEQERLLALFGTPDRWGQTVRPFAWAGVGVTVPAFTGETAVDLPVPCDRGADRAAAVYLDALDGGEAALTFLFSGTVFYEAEGVGPQVGMIPWDREARFRLPVPLWKGRHGEAAGP